MRQESSNNEYDSASEFRIVIDTDALVGRVVDGLSARLGGFGAAMTKRLLTVEEAGQYLGRTAHAIRKLIEKGTLPRVQHDGRVFLDVRDLDTWIDEGKD